jgi:hypothetical protein
MSDVALRLRAGRSVECSPEETEAGCWLRVSWAWLESCMDRARTSAPLRAGVPSAVPSKKKSVLPRFNYVLPCMLKNYTSSVPVAKTVSRIEEVIAKSGASGITKDYEAGHLTALCFHISLPNGKLVTIRLPANTEAVQQAMLKNVKRQRAGTRAKIMEQAERTAWKLMQDWVEIQLSLIEMQQAEWLQVFLPYIWDGKQTLYTMLKEGQFKALPEFCGS